MFLILEMIYFNKVFPMILGRLLSFFFATISLFSANAGESKLKVGQDAPEVVLSDQAGNMVNLSSYKGKKNVVLYFYPKDGTLGCSIEAKKFQDLKPEFAKLDTVVIGVSEDSQASHQSFSSSKNLDFILLSDIGGLVASRYESYKKGALFSVLRNTFVIGKDGKIKAIWRGVNPISNPKEVFNFVKKLPTAGDYATSDTNLPSPR